VLQKRLIANRIREPVRLISELPGTPSETVEIPQVPPRVAAARPIANQLPTTFLTNSTNSTLRGSERRICVPQTCKVRRSLPSSAQDARPSGHRVFLGNSARCRLPDASVPAKSRARFRSFTETDFRADLANIARSTLIIQGTADVSAPIDITGRRPRS
jgi:pimeloyl-ACP methyl ester carboxylesterase